ncbi:hypothetical protein ACFL2A_02760 [Thermodesulfobacteriota bacterium]
MKTTKKEWQSQIINKQGDLVMYTGVLDNKSDQIDSDDILKDYKGNLFILIRREDGQYHCKNNEETFPLGVFVGDRADLPHINKTRRDLEIFRNKINDEELYNNIVKGEITNISQAG